VPIENLKVVYAKILSAVEEFRHEGEVKEGCAAFGSHSNP
jgi:hypothetical protein